MKDALGGVQSVLVLGGTSEIGLACVRALDLRPGARVVLAGRDAAALEQAGASIGATVTTAVWDADAADPVAGAQAVLAGAEWDVVLVAAGVLGDQERAERDAAHAVEIWRTNLVGVGAAVLQAGQVLRQQGHGTLVVLSSVAAVRPRRANFIYGSSKSGLDAVTAGLGDALHGCGVVVLVVRPGFVHTRMTQGLPAAPFATTPERVGSAVAAAVRAGRSGVVWVPGILRLVFGLLRLAPAPLWRRMGSS
jgi:decaprenylphospho-beta-D-erythro-pentofuranosid-2-ulose 2-reductase